VPGALEGGASSLDGDIDILLGGLVDGGDDLFVGGVDGLEGLALDTLDELVVDEPAERGKKRMLVWGQSFGMARGDWTDERERFIVERPRRKE
jgi:hypothetical protein